LHGQRSGPQAISMRWRADFTDVEYIVNSIAGAAVRG